MNIVRTFTIIAAFISTVYGNQELENFLILIPQKDHKAFTQYYLKNCEKPFRRRSFHRHEYKRLSVKFPGHAQAYDTNINVQLLMGMYVEFKNVQEEKKPFLLKLFSKKEKNKRVHTIL